ncbi:MAG: amidohydrolase family protein [Lentisphaeria bacterium]|jgi:predicted TIM-barrel fold metal-dependent hydrolase|nr:amidohydrolase family protein [Lentisphaeria bacterium]MDP7741057.1 amidohydrolase family protein [Lentisphaeria bacterium]
MKRDFVDCHFHLWDLNEPGLHYCWLMPDGEDPQLGKRLEELKGTTYLIDDYIAETRQANVTKAVHLQAAIGSQNPVTETAWIQAAADRTGFALAIVGYTDLKNPNAGKELEQHCRYASTRGIRDFSEGDYLVDPDFHRGYALLAEFDLVASLSIDWQAMPKAHDLARKFPHIPLVLDHCGEPSGRDDEYFENWRNGMRTVAQAENVICKISGLGMADNDWTIDSIRRWVLTCIDVFGPHRCIFGTNWPVDKLYSTYDVLIDAYTGIIADFTSDEQDAMFSGNAAALYRI